MNPICIPVTLELQVSKNGKPYVCIVANLGWRQKRLAFGRDALDIFGYPVRDVNYSNAPTVLSRGELTIS